MLNRNEYFEEMKRITEEYTKNKRAHEEKKKEIINTFGWDSNELKNWYEEHDKMKYPIESGAAKAYRAFQYSLANGNEEFEMEDFLWDREVEDFVTLENAETGAVVRKKIKSKDGVEYVIPLGIDGNSASALWANVPTESEPEVEFVN